MIFTKLEIDNLYCFSNTIIDFTFPKKIQNTTIPGEFLRERNNFNVKRVCIFSGANASGKTSLGRLMCDIQNFIVGAKRVSNSIGKLIKSITNRAEPAALSVEFVTELDNKLHKLELCFLPSDETKETDLVGIRYASVPILKFDSSQAAREKLERVFLVGDKEQVPRSNYDEFAISLGEPFFVDGILSNIIGQENLSWHYIFSETQDNGVKEDYKKNSLDIKVLSTVLKSFDSSIDSVQESFAIEPSSEEKKPNGFQIFFKNRASVFIDLEGEGTAKGISRLSRGTYEAIGVAGFISSIKRNKGNDTVWFMDEKMAYAHSELEQSIISVMIGLLGERSQLFYTTHNSDVLSMNLPVHSYLFLKKEGGFAQAIQPEKQFKKNDRELSNAIKNDLFGTVPDSSSILGLLDKDD